MLDCLKKNDSMESMPLVTIITVNYNNADNLKRTLNSIDKQIYRRIESIIIDAGSKDNSLDVIKEFSGKFTDVDRKCKWVSEPDDGLYYAINKALTKVTGDIVGCLWDEFHDENSLSLLIAKMLEQNADGVHGDLLYVDENNNPVRTWVMGDGKLKDGWMPGHPTLYLRKEIYDKYGKYDTSFKSAADYEFMIRFLKNEEIHLAYVPQVVVEMYYGGLSTSNPKAYYRSTIEAYKALRKNRVKQAWLIILKRILITIKQFR